MKTNYVLIDFENVTPDNLDLLDQEWIRVFLFVGKNQTKLPFPMVKAIQKLGSRAEYVEMTGTGHNALDFTSLFTLDASLRPIKTLISTSFPMTRDSIRS